MRGKDGEAASGAPYEEYLTALLRGLVNNPAEVKIEKTNDDRGVLLRARVAKSDMGIVIGRRGQTMTAIRYLVGVVGARENARVSVMLVDEERGER